MAVVFSWRWESGFYARSELKFQLLFKVTLYDLNVRHIIFSLFDKDTFLFCND